MAPDPRLEDGTPACRERPVAELAARLEIREIDVFRLAHRMLGRCRALYGLIQGSDSIATAQLCRLARDAGLGDSLAVFTRAAEAKSFWSELEQAALAERIERAG